MKTAEVKKIVPGLYEVFWKESKGGGSSLAAVGILYNGDRWLAPTNWTGETNPTGSGNAWKAVKRIELIKTKHELK